MQKAEDLVNCLVTEASASTANTADAFKLCGLFSFETICKAAFAKDFDGPIGYDSSLALIRAMDGSAMSILVDAVLPFLRLTGLGLLRRSALADATASVKVFPGKGSTSL
ncbi:hypothetical protein NX059_001299 [Plenodomus lindquistii]|nr:hypothetical protein NX059_001299 [Plenodomus lindquistii]